MTYPVTKYYTEPHDDDLETIDRIAARRAEIEAVRPTRRREREVRDFLLRTLDEMEETLCLQGSRARVVSKGWRTLADFESFGRRGGGKR